MILDSGAYSAWTRKTSIDLDAYIQFIIYHQKVVDHYVNLDVIPGEFGRVPSPKEVEASAAKGWNNLLYMEEHGLEPMPVFHMGEQFKWLDKMINHGCDYVGISPANDRTTQQKLVWLDQVFSHIADADGWPIIKTHGFGVTSVPILFRYPWYSADSTSWILTGAFGSMLIPKWNKVFLYDRPPHVVSVSARKNKSSMEGARNFDTFGEETQKHLIAYIESVGTTIQQVKDSCLHRSLVTAAFLRDLSANMPQKPFKITKRGLL